MRMGAAHIKLLCPPIFSLATRFGRNRSRFSGPIYSVTRPLISGAISVNRGKKGVDSFLPPAINFRLTLRHTTIKRYGKRRVGEKFFESLRL